MANNEIPQRAKMILAGVVLLFLGTWRVSMMNAHEEARIRLIHEHESLNADGVLWLPNGKIQITVYPDRNLLETMEIVTRMGYTTTHLTVAPRQLTEGSAKSIPMRLIATVERRTEYHPVF